MPGPFPAEITAVPLSSPLPPLSPVSSPSCFSLRVLLPCHPLRRQLDLLRLRAGELRRLHDRASTSFAVPVTRARSMAAPLRFLPSFDASASASTGQGSARPPWSPPTLRGIQIRRSCSPSPRPPPPPPRPRSPRPHSAPPSTPARPLRWCISLARPHSIGSATYSAVPSSTAVLPGTAQLAKSASIIRRAPAEQV